MKPTSSIVFIGSLLFIWFMMHNSFYFFAFLFFFSFSRALLAPTRRRNNIILQTCWLLWKRKCKRIYPYFDMEIYFHTYTMDICIINNLIQRHYFCILYEKIENKSMKKKKKHMILIQFNIFRLTSPVHNAKRPSGALCF